MTGGAFCFIIISNKCSVFFEKGGDTVEKRQYICIDLKSYYASVECVERGLDPLDTNLVVADIGRTEKTICLAVSPALKSYGIPGRARLFEVVSAVEQINKSRMFTAKIKEFSASSYSASELSKNKKLSLDYIVAPPQMRLYMEKSVEIYSVYLKFVAPEDIHVYSVDEVFIDVTHYLLAYKMTARELAVKMIKEVLEKTGITATAGVGTNMYLAKVALDIVAKKIPADSDGVRIAELDEASYRRILWSHRPITDFWRVGNGYKTKLENNSLFTMGDIAYCSVHNEEALYKMFGVNAELLIDHSWGYEPCTIKDVKSYKSQSTGVSTGQVLKEPYNFEKAELIVKEMTELLSLDLVRRGVLTDKVVLHIGYDIENIKNPKILKNYSGEIVTDRYGRKTPKHSHGTENLSEYTASTKILCNAVNKLYNSIVDKNLLIRRINITACNTLKETEITKKNILQFDLFTDSNVAIKNAEIHDLNLGKEKNIQKVIIKIKHRFGKNAIIKGMNLSEGGTTIERNAQIGGHRA